MYSWGPDIAGTRYCHFAVGINAVTLEGGSERRREGGRVKRGKGTNHAVV